MDTAMQASGAKMKDRAKKMFGLDLRSLAFARIFFALILLGDLINRAWSLAADYTDQGILPRAALDNLFHTLYGSTWIFSLHLLGGSWEFQSLLFLIAGIFAVMLLVGYRTRLATIVSWLLLLSLQFRNPIILQGGDILLRVALFFAIFLPWGAYYSFDSIRKRSREADRGPLYFSGGTIAFILQIAFLYWFTVLFKFSGVDWVHGMAVYYSLSIQQMATPFGHFLLGFPTLLTLMTFGVLALESLGPFLFFSPWFTEESRIFIVAALTLFQAGLGFSIYLGIFPWVAIAVVVALLPGLFWSKLEKFFHRYVAERWKNKRSPLQESPATQGRFWTITEHVLLDILPLLFIIYVLLWNVTEYVPQTYALPLGWQSPGITIGLSQRWDMFAPDPFKDDGWYVIPGQLRDGTIVNVFENGAPLDWSQPESIPSLYVGERWQRYMMNIWSGQYAGYRPYYAEYLCNTWNASHPYEQQLTSLAIVFMLKEVLPNYESSAPLPFTLWQQNCSDTMSTSSISTIPNFVNPESVNPNFLP